MQLTFRLNRAYSIGHPLNKQMRDLGYTDAGFIPPRYGFNRRLGLTDFQKLLREAERLNAIMAPDTPMMIDYEKAFRWARANPPGPRDGIPLSPIGCYDLIREVYNFMRRNFAERHLTDWGRNAGWTNELTDRLGGALTVCCPNCNKKANWDDDHWMAVRSQEYAENVDLWRMPIYLSLTDYVATAGAGGTARWISDDEWDMTCTFTVEREPDWICLMGGGPQFLERAKQLRDTVNRTPEF